jgi:hypothetical protein
MAVTKTDERIRELVLHSIGLINSLENNLRQLQDLVPDYGMGITARDVAKSRDDVGEVLLVVDGIPYEDED